VVLALATPLENIGANIPKQMTSATEYLRLIFVLLVNRFITGILPDPLLDPKHDTFPQHAHCEMQAGTDCARNYQHREHSCDIIIGLL